jgi:uncharacterized protein YndB with AHSA1/START domain
VAEKYTVVLEARVGGRYEEHGTIGDEEWTNVGQVLIYDPPRQMAFTLQTRRGDGSLSPLTTVTLTLADLGNRTRVTLEHDLEGSARNQREPKVRRLDAGWAHALEELRIIAIAGASPEMVDSPQRVVRKQIEIDAPPNRVWPYVATAEGCRRWFCTVADQYALTLEAKVGGRFEQQMTVRGKRYHSVGEVLLYDPPRRIIFTTRSADRSGSPAASTMVTILVTDLGDRTRVSVQESGFERLPEDQRDQIFRSTDQGWAAAMEDLYGLLMEEALPQLGHLFVYQTIEINAPADRVWWFVATEEGRRERERRIGYPPGHIEHEIFEAREGGQWESAGTSAHMGDRYRQFGRILTYDPPRLLVMTLQEEGWSAETTVTYRLTEYFGRTRVTLIHSGFEKLKPQRRAMTRKAYEIGRFKSLERLRALIEGGESAPHWPLYVRQEIEIDAPIERVWHFVGTQEGSLKRHQLERVPGRTDYQAETLEARVGGRYELRGVYEGTPFRIVGEVLAYDPPHLLALSWREEQWPVETLVRFRLQEAGGRTYLTVIHNGFEHLPSEYREKTLKEYEAGRKRGLDVLKALLGPRDFE